jgi:outer membrane protein assembly factor BamB
MFSSTSSAEDWPQFRGPTGAGLSQGKALPTEWDESRNVIWRQAIPGVAWSSPVVDSGKIFLTTAVKVEDTDKDWSLEAICLDASTGALSWRVPIFRQDGSAAPNIHSKNSHASPTPLVEGDRVYVHFGHQGTACLDRSGKVVWQSRELSYPPVHGNGPSPIIFGQALILVCDGGDKPFVAALDKATGDLLWKFERTFDTGKKFSFCTPTVIDVAGTPQLVSPGAGGVSALDPLTGQEIWHVRYDGYSVIPKPVFGQGLVYVCTGFDAPVLLAIRPDGTGDVTDTHVAWRETRSVPLTPSLLLDGDELYLISDRGVASCLDARTGSLHWRERVGGEYSASPLLANRKIYFQSETGTGYVIRAAREYELLAENKLEERSLASTAASDGAIFLRTEKHLFRIENQESRTAASSP